MHDYTHTSMHVDARVRVRAHTHKHTHTYKHTHTHTHTHTHIHTHKQVRLMCYWSSGFKIFADITVCIIGFSISTPPTHLYLSYPIPPIPSPCWHTTCKQANTTCKTCFSKSGHICLLAMEL